MTDRGDVGPAGPGGRSDGGSGAPEDSSPGDGGAPHADRCEAASSDTDTGSSANPAVPLLQSEWWRRVKAAGGWRGVATEPRVLQRTIGPFRLAYAPHAFAGNNTDIGGNTDIDDLGRITTVFREIGDRNGATLLRWDVPWPRDDRLTAALGDRGWRPAPMRVQPPDTVIVPLDESPGEILRRMKSKTRYNVRLAGKKGVSVTVATGTELLAALPEWYRLYQETAERDRITIHPEGYYRHVVEIADAMRAEGLAAPDLSLYLARHDGDLLGGIIVTSWGGTSTYLYGASSNTKRNLMANYLLQWEAMQGAIRRGDVSYDLFGIPESDDPAHPMHGLYRFKTGFGGAIVHRAGAWDLPIDTVGTAAYRAAERVRKWYYFRVRKGFGRAGG
jgi:hypothetical protein